MTYMRRNRNRPIRENKGRATVTPFVPRAAQPHLTTYLRCMCCGHEAWHVYPERTPLPKLHCVCRAVGAMAIAQRPCASCGCKALEHPTSNAPIPLPSLCSCGACTGYSEHQGPPDSA